MTQPLCPPWCDGHHHAEGDHRYEVFYGHGPGGTAHIDLVQPPGEPIEILLVLEYDDPEHLEADEPLEPSRETYTAAAARHLAGLAHLHEHLEEFAESLAEAARLTDAHQHPDAVVPHVPVPVPTRVWVQVLACDEAGLPPGWA